MKDKTCTSIDVGTPEKKNVTQKEAKKKKKKGV